MQILYLSARPTLLEETLGHVRHFAPIIDDVVAVVPEAMRSRFAFVESGGGTLITDEELLEQPTAAIRAMAHTSRNYALRTAAASHPALAATYIMSDDDSRPLVPIDESTFIDADGRHRRRWFHTMEAWRHANTEFDESILNTWVILRQMGFVNPVSYASHMPQIVHKLLYAEVAEKFDRYADKYALEEWSTYFTLAPTFAPELFAEPEPFGTLGWPQYPGEWPHQITPPRHIYENHHPELHEPGGLYDGLPRACDPETIDAANIEKIIRWYRLDGQVRELDFPDDVDQPWTSSSAGRRVAFKGLRLARGAAKYLGLDERARLAALEGRIEQLERNEP
ncbi:MAG: hypothetical protein EX269_14535 [Acidimicrobiales bacterium]|nr:MAG: hypothetical protein EX269_14535 [Acidimicrobiales bacterium]